MKRYIPSILIPCLLMQLFGCYTFKTIQNDEIEKHFQDETIIIKTTDQQEFLLQKDVSSEEIISNPRTKYCTEYKLLNDSLFLLKKKAGNISMGETGSTIKTILSDSVFIRNDVISEIAYRKVSPWIYVGTAALLVGIGWAIFFEEKNDLDRIGWGL